MHQKPQQLLYKAEPKGQENVVKDVLSTIRERLQNTKTWILLEIGSFDRQIIGR